MPWSPTWEQTLDEEITDFNSLIPAAWDGIADFEEGDTTDFDAEADADNHLNASSDANHDGTYGIEITFADANVAYGFLNLDSTGSTSFVTTFWWNRNDAVIGSGKIVFLCQAFADTEVFAFYIAKTGGNYYTTIKTVEDDDTPTYTGGSAQVGSGWHKFTIVAVPATGVGANNGYFLVFVDDVLDIELTGQDTDLKVFNKAIYGMIYTSETGFGGSYYMDSIYLDTIGPPQVDKLSVQVGTYGLTVNVIPTTASSYGIFTGPTNDLLFGIKFQFDPNALAMGAADNFQLCQAIDADTEGIAGYLQVSGTDGYQIRQVYCSDGDPPSTTAGAWYPLSDANHEITWAIFMSSGIGANTGYMHLWLDSALLESKTGIDNDMFDVDTVRIGVISGHAATTYGILHFDEIMWADNTLQPRANAGAATPAGAKTNVGKKVLAGAFTGAGAETNVGKKVLAGAFEIVGALQSWTVYKVASGVLTPAGTVVKLVRYNLTGALSFVGTVVKIVKKVIGDGVANTLSSTGSVSKIVKKAFAGVLSFVGTVIQKVPIVFKLLFNLTPSGSIQIDTIPEGDIDVNVTPEGSIDLRRN